MRAVEYKDHKFQVVDGRYNKWDFWKAFEEGSWEPNLLGEIASLPLYTLLFDVGAWIGPIALWAASHGTKVIAIEPDPVALDELRQNIEASELGSMITVVPAGLMVKAGTVSLNIQNGGGDSQSSMARTNMSESVQVTTVTLNSLMKKYGVPDMVKMDVEGAEGWILPAIGPKLRYLNIPIILSLHWGWLPEGTREALDEELSHWELIRNIEKDTALYGPLP